MSRPQEIDEAARRRFVKRLYIPLPTSEARKMIIKNLLEGGLVCVFDIAIAILRWCFVGQSHSLTEEEMDQISEGTKGEDCLRELGTKSVGFVTPVNSSRLQWIGHERAVHRSSLGTHTR